MDRLQEILDAGNTTTSFGAAEIAVILLLSFVLTSTIAVAYRGWR